MPLQNSHLSVRTVFSIITFHRCQTWARISQRSLSLLAYRRLFNGSLKTHLSFSNNFEYFFSHRIQVSTQRKLASFSSGDSGFWEQPSGYDTGVMVWHPIVRRKVPLILKQKKVAQWYMCGPTVYDSAHIGHASSYVRFDIIRRILNKTFGVDMVVVMGITDIDDKIIKRTKESRKTMTQLTQAYEVEFLHDMTALNVLLPLRVTRVTDHVPHIILFIQRILDNGFAYVTSDGSIYFDVEKYGRCGQMRHTPPESAPSDPFKKTAADFALWKAAKEGEPCWQAPWSKGRPGWHIECSAMASAMFGSNFDIHTGGVDLMFPHHENEIAQSQAHFGCKQWANYWFHTGHLHMKDDREKMSKSLKNTLNVSQLLESYTPNQFRMLCLLTHYRNSIEFSDELMEKSVALITQLNSLVTQCDAYVQGHFDSPGISQPDLFERILAVRETVEKAYSDDFNTPRAMEAVFGLMKSVNQMLATKTEVLSTGPRSCSAIGAVSVFICHILSDLGIDLGQRKAEESTDSKQEFQFVMNTLIDFRSRIRSFVMNSSHVQQVLAKHSLPPDLANGICKELSSPLLDACDSLRDQLATVNIRLKDIRKETTWSFEDQQKAKMKTSKISSS